MVDAAGEDHSDSLEIQRLGHCAAPLHTAARRGFSRPATGRLTSAGQGRALQADPGWPWPECRLVDRNRTPGLVSAAGGGRISEHPFHVPFCHTCSEAWPPHPRPVFSSCSAPGTLLRDWKERESEARGGGPRPRLWDKGQVTEGQQSLQGTPTLIPNLQTRELSRFPWDTHLRLPPTSARHPESSALRLLPSPLPPPPEAGGWKSDIWCCSRGAQVLPPTHPNTPLPPRPRKRSGPRVPGRGGEGLGALRLL